jgi:hypothetical protein
MEEPNNYNYVQMDFQKDQVPVYGNTDVDNSSPIPFSDINQNVMNRYPTGQFWN